MISYQSTELIYVGITEIKYPKPSEKIHLAFSHSPPLPRDARVLRQIKYLSSLYDLTMIGYGPPHSGYKDLPHIKWLQLGETAQQVPNLITALKTHDYKNIKFWTRLVHKIKQLRNKTFSVIGHYIPSSI